MLKWIDAVAWLSLFVASAEGDYVTERKAAVALVHTGKHDEALAAFLRMADIAASAVQKSDALRQAALCADTLQRHELAVELAKKIPLAPLSKACQMQLMEGRRQWQVIVEKYKDEDFHTWPESVRGDAFFGRGHAYFLTKSGTMAVSDLVQAADFLTDGNSKALCLICLGDTYSALLKSDDKAVETYRKAYGNGNVYKHCQAAINVANILKRQRKHAAAIEELSRIKMDEVRAPYWRGSTLCAIGEAFAGAGRKADAISRYKEAIGIEGLPSTIRKECEMAMKRLTMDSK